MAEIAGVWVTKAPERLLGDATALSAFAAGLEGGFDRAIDSLIGEAPSDIDAELETVRRALSDIYAEALAFAAGDSTAAPVQTDAQRTALDRVDTWARSQCANPSW